MPDNRNRKRPIQVKFFVDEKELSLIKARMAQLGIENMSAYLLSRILSVMSERDTYARQQESQATDTGQILRR